MLQVIPLKNIKIVMPGDDILKIIYNAILDNKIKVQDYDIFVVAHKIVSRSENRLVKPSKIVPSPQAKQIAEKTDIDPRKMQAILNESRRIIKSGSKKIITESNLGFICANSGVDRSNAYINDSLILLPKNPQKICRKIRDFLEKKFKCKIGVIISDTHGRALRKGAQGVAIAVSGFSGLLSYEGKKDIFGYELKSTKIAVADELASSAELVMGEADEKIPIALIRGLKFEPQEGLIEDLLYESGESLFY
jgi:coenzyme F420-0:L-glutamate ligase/coenzyme F420-1:gamma-L-glutamate ligase